MGRSAGDFVYRGAASDFPLSWSLELHLQGGEADAGATARWIEDVGVPELRVVLWEDGEARCLAPAAPPPGARHDGEIEAAWVYAPGRLPPIDPAHLHGLLLIAAGEAVDAVLLVPDGRPRRVDTADDAADALPDSDTVESLGVDELLEPRWRRFTLFRSAAFDYSPEDDQIVPRHRRWLAKIVSRNGATVVPGHSDGDGPLRRGPYRSPVSLPARLEVGLRDAALLPRTPRIADPERPALLVTTPFLARGGAEQTLWETLRHLVERFEITLATLAPHRPELDDRRQDFRALGIPILSLGDWVHPAAMEGMLCSLVESLAPVALYNANGTTLFYDFAPRLKRLRPAMRIIDHLYDHRVGYVERYDPELLEHVDVCVAENHPIQSTLLERGWSTERVPVIWPCGRAEDAFPAPETRGERRSALRRELGIDDDTVLFLTAARMHPQKRPLDLVRLAERLRGHRVFFLVVGGGDLEDEVDAAIAAATARDGPLPIRRLGFRDDIPELILAADVGCLVSDFEGLPVFLLECLQAGRPFLGTEVGDLGRVLRQTGAGPVVDRPGDLQALEAAVHRLLDDDTRRHFAERALAAGPAFGVEACAERYAAVFLGREVSAIGPPHPSPFPPGREGTRRGPGESAGTSRGEGG